MAFEGIIEILSGLDGLDYRFTLTRLVGLSLPVSVESAQPQGGLRFDPKENAGKCGNTANPNKISALKDFDKCAARSNLLKNTL